MKILTILLCFCPILLFAQGKIGINTANPDHPFQVNVDSAFMAVSLDQNNVGTLNTLSLTPGTNMGAQSLTVGVTGQLAKISITLGASDIDQLLITAYRGNGPEGTWMAEQTIYDINSSGIFEVTFPQPWPTVTAGEIINFVAFPVTGSSMAWRRSTTNTYAGGQAYFFNGSAWSTLSYDLAFKSYVAEPDTTSVDVLSVQDNGRVRVKNYVLPELDGTEGQVMGTDGAGTLQWMNPDTSSSQSEILDDDGDTRVKVEAAPDEDIIRFSTAGSEKMNILSNGNVGIGIDPATARLHVRHNSATSNPQLRLTETSANDYARIKFETESDPGLFWDLAAKTDSSATESKLNFYYSNPGFTGDKMTITGEGNVGIGSTSPINRLRVNGSTTSSQHVLTVGTNYAGNVHIRAVEGISTPAVGYGIGGYFIGGQKGIESIGTGGAASGQTFGVIGGSTGTAGTHIGLYGWATGGATNWAGYFAQGNVMAENNLYINESVGIGTTSPGNKLRVNGSATSSQHVFSAGTNYSGNVHIRAVEGFSTPATGYGIGGYFQGGQKGVESIGSGGSATGETIGVIGGSTGTAGTRTGLYGWATGGSINWAGYFAQGNVYVTNELRIGSGALGGATGYKVAIDGKLIAEEVRVQLSDDWPDYVFHQDYHLMSLDQLRQEISDLGHLPGIPSAIEMEIEGIQLGDMQIRMMKKIEELSLYILQQEERLKLLERQLTEFQSNNR